MTKFNFDIILYGGPGAGKGTQAELLRDKISALHLNMGAELRALAGQETKLAKELQQTLAQGQLVPLSVTAQVAKGFVEKSGDATIIFDGYPRTIEQANDLDAILKTHGRVAKLVYLELPMEVAVERLTKRAELEHRADDMDEAAVTERIEIFQRNAATLLGRYRDLGLLITVDGDGTVEEVADRLFETLTHAN
ncbi:MAG: nucleoside monophosphate kinase [Patescibacteria group bacterium]|nr:nucleoside monophosphate kinase [Patescibacteria group bacterium]